MVSTDHERIQKDIKKEENRLKKIYSEIEDRRKNTIAGLIQRAAFMRVQLDELEAELNLNGFTEKFSQGDQDPYDRERPAARIYNSMNSGYQKIIKQLTDLLPRDDARPKGGDSFADF